MPTWGSRQGVRSAKIPGFDFTAPIQCDILNSNSHLGPGNKQSFRVHRGTTQQLIMAEANSTYKLKFMHLVIRY